MNIRFQVYKLRKRLHDTELIRIQKIVSEEIERRSENDKNNQSKRS